MRPAGDRTSGAELKRAWLHEPRIKLVDFVFEDDAAVVEMWRDEGVPCLQITRGLLP